MRIAVFHHLPSGGALRALRDKLMLFKKMGHECEVYTLSSADLNGFDWQREASRVIIESFDPAAPRALKRYFDLCRSIARRIDASGADRVWVEKCRLTGSPPVLQFLRKRAIFYSQEPLRIRAHEALADGSDAAPVAALRPLSIPQILGKLRHFRRHLLIKTEDRKSMLASGRLFANSRYSALWHQRVYGIEPEVLYQGVDTDFFSPDRFSAATQVISVGRIEPLKGHDFLVDVLAKLPREQRPRLAVVGARTDAGYARGLEEKARRLHVQLAVHENVSDGELRGHYRGSFAALCASVHEPFGLVPLEAMACGIPVLAVDEGGYRETVLHDRNGFLIAREAGEWARRLGLLGLHPGTAERIGAAGRKDAVERWSMEAFGRALEKAL